MALRDARPSNAQRVEHDAYNFFTAPPKTFNGANTVAGGLANQLSAGGATEEAMARMFLDALNGQGNFGLNATSNLVGQ